MNNPPVKKIAHITVELPVELYTAMDKYLNERRFETRSAMIAEALQTWIDCEEDETFYEVIQKHEEWDGKSPHPYGCDGGDGEE